MLNVFALLSPNSNAELKCGAEDHIIKEICCSEPATGTLEALGLRCSNMRDDDRFIWVSALGKSRQQPAHVRTIIRKHVMRDIGKSRRKSGRKDALNDHGKDTAFSPAAASIAVVPGSAKAVEHQNMMLCLCRSLSNDNTREPLVCRSTIDRLRCS